MVDPGGVDPDPDPTFKKFLSRPRKKRPYPDPTGPDPTGPDPDPCWQPV